MDDRRKDRFEASCSLLLSSGCFPTENFDSNDDAVLALIEDKMRCNVLNCLASILVVRKERKKLQKATDNVKYDILKRKVFAGACSLMIETESDSDEVFVKTVLSSFPDKTKMSDERTWLPMHFAMVLFLQNKISAEDIYFMHTVDVLAMYRFSEKEHTDEEFGMIGCTPAHLLCMHKASNVSMVKHFCAHDREEFLLCDQNGRCALHLAAQYSESVELLQTLLQMDGKMTTEIFFDADYEEIMPLCLLCRRCEFPTFHEMVACLIAADSTAAIIHNGINGCLQSYKDSQSKDHLVYPGSRGEKTMILLEILMNMKVVAKEDYTWIFSQACTYLRGELGIAVLSLLLTKDNTLVKNVDSNGDMPICHAASNSSLDVLKFLLKACPESVCILGDMEESLLHLAFETKDFTNRREKVEYLCHHYPNLIPQKNKYGHTPLQSTLIWGSLFDFKSITCICNVDESVLKDICIPNFDIDSSMDNMDRYEQLPLHLLTARMRGNPPISELSDEGDCFRLFLRMYPASAGFKNRHNCSPYNLANSWIYRSEKLSVYFRRLLLAADPTIDPMERRNLNYAARRDGMFLAFKALSVNGDPTIWSNLKHKGNDLLARVLAYL